MKQFNKTNRKAFVTFLVFSIAVLSNHASFASILNMEQNNQGISYFESRFSKDYEFIFFYSPGCAYCERFAPILKKYSDNSGINVRGFVLGSGSINKESNYFPNSTVVKREVIEDFFGKDKGIAVPTLFIANKNNFHTYPVSQGALTYLELVRRMDELIPKILTNEAKMKR